MKRRAMLLLAVMGAVLVLGGGVALAEVLLGTDDPNRIEGTDDPDQITGLGGNDTLIGKAGDDQIDGGEGNDDIQLFKDLKNDSSNSGGNDTILGGNGVDIIGGGSNDDTVNGGGESDAVGGGPDDDTLFGEAGDDLVFGGFGGDQVDGGEGNDLVFDGVIVILEKGDEVRKGDVRPSKELCNTDINRRIFGGPGKCVVRQAKDDKDQDSLSGGDGDDRLFAYNKPASMDTVNCGPGNDTARVDREDVVARDCENVKVVS